MDIRPQDLPELRAEIVACLDRHPTRDKWEHALRSGQSIFSQADKLPEDAAGLFSRMERSRLAKAELFYVAPDMVALAKAAAETLPIFEMEHEDLPVPCGFMAFGAPIEELSWGEPPIPTSIVAANWSVYGTESERGVWISFFTERSVALAGAAAAGVSAEAIAYNRSELPRITPMLASDSIWNFHSEGRSEPVNATAAALDRTGRAIRSAWLLMQQPLAEVSEVQADRAARKRLRREGREPAAVRVIELRRPKHTGTEPAESGRNYVHRWITRGHWRQQWYATRQVHRPVWIAPHVKGPEGAPMIGGEKVYAWKR